MGNKVTPSGDDSMSTMTQLAIWVDLRLNTFHISYPEIDDKGND